MLLKGEGIFAGQELKTSKKTGQIYTIIRILDTNGKLFEMLSDNPVSAEQYKTIIFEVEVIQGQYPKYNFKNIINK